MNHRGLRTNIYIVLRLRSQNVCEGYRVRFCGLAEIFSCKYTKGLQVDAHSPINLFTCR